MLLEIFLNVSLILGIVGAMLGLLVVISLVVTILNFWFGR